MSALVAERRRHIDSGDTFPVQLVDFRTREGEGMRRMLSSDGHAALLAELLHRDRAGFVEVVGARRCLDGRLDRFDRRCVDAGDRDGLLDRVAGLREGERAEVFLTPATLRIPFPGNASVDRCAVAWVDIDDPRRLRTLRRFPHGPHAVVASGSGGAHAYWRLDSELSGEHCEVLNRKLASAIGADMASCNRGRILRVPGTRNWKPAVAGSGPAWCRVVMCDLAKDPYDPRIIARGLRDPKAPRRTRALRLPRAGAAAEPWDGLEAAEYYRVITGREPSRDGKVRCPNLHHDDRHPSAHLYRGVGKGWYCFACQVGGGAIDMVAAMHGYPTGSALRREEFSRCVAELREKFGMQAKGDG